MHPDSAIDRLANSINEFGWTNPVLVSKDNYILAGHARLKAAQKAELKKIPIIRLPLSGDKALAYMIADNKLQDMTDWDLPTLKDLLVDIDTGAFQIDITGFDESTISELIAQTKPVDEDEEDERVKDIKKGLKEGVMIVIGWYQILVRPGMPEFDKLWEFAGKKKKWSEEETQDILKKIHEAI